MQTCLGDEGHWLPQPRRARRRPLQQPARIICPTLQRPNIILHPQPPSKPPRRRARLNPRTSDPLPALHKARRSGQHARKVRSRQDDRDPIRRFPCSSQLRIIARRQQRVRRVGILEPEARLAIQLPPRPRTRYPQLVPPYLPSLSTKLRVVRRPDPNPYAVRASRERDVCEPVLHSQDAARCQVHIRGSGRPRESLGGRVGDEEGEWKGGREGGEEGGRWSAEVEGNVDFCGGGGRGGEEEDGAGCGS